jgi:hypothetical protein
MGTFKIRPTILSQGPSLSYYPNIDSTPQGVNPGTWSYWYAGISAPDSATIIQIVSRQNLGTMYEILQNKAGNNNPQTANDLLRFWFTGNCIYLDGSSTPISINTLPVGWTPLTAILSVNPTPTTYNLPTLTQHFFLQLDALTEGVQDSPTLAYSSPPTAIDLLSNGCGIRTTIHIDNSAAAGSLDIEEIVIDGTYGIAQSTPVIVQQNPTTPVSFGDSTKFIITTAEAAGTPISGSTIYGTLKDVIQIQLSWIDSSGISHTTLIDNTHNQYSIIVNTQSELWFTLPLGFGSFSGTVNITFIFDGTQFSGSVLVGTLQVLFENASGIYVLDNSQVHDTLYFREGHITDNKLIMLPNMIENVTYTEMFYEDDFFNMLSYPRKILAEDAIEEDIEGGDFSIISILRTVIVLIDVNVPSPFIKTAFLPE